MKGIKRVLVALDMSPMDEELIAYTAHLNQILRFDVIYFFHAATSLMLPKEVVEKYPDLIAPVDESLENLIKDRLGSFFDTDTTTKIEIHEGDASDKILRWSQIKEVDLMIMGKKDKLKGSGLLPSRMTKVGYCSLLMVCEGCGVGLQKIMTAVDFSPSSKSALQQAVSLARQSNTKLLIQNTYIVPSGFYKIGKTYKEFAGIMKEHSRRDLEKFIAGEGLDTIDHEIILSLDDNDEPSDKIYADAHAHDVDMIIIGSKGRTGLANIFLGSVAEKLLGLQRKIPVLVVKNKNRNLGFLEAVLRI